MAIIYAIPITISSLLIGAHFLRAGMPVLTAACLLMPALLMLKKRWVPTAITIYLLAASAEWLRTLLNLISVYQAHRVDSTRMTIILTGVILFTAASILVLRTDTMKRRYTSGDDTRLAGL